MVDIKTILFIIVGLYLFGVIYFGIIKKLGLGKLFKFIILAIIVGVALYFLYLYKFF